MAKKYDYDVVIIGAGISGLVCGCYLAKGGLKTLIVEKNSQAGGYCTSFSRKGFYFDSCAHAFSSLSKNGVFRKICKELELLSEVQFIRNNPSDIVITSTTKLKFFNDVNETIKSWQRVFPEDRREIKKFFKFIDQTNQFFGYRSKTFKEVLNDFFKNSKITTILSLTISSTVGVSADKLSAIMGLLLLKEFIFDGGYYPKGGMQEFVDILTKKIKEFKGDVLCNKSVQKINLKNGKVEGVLLDDRTDFTAKYVVSACDMARTFFKLIGNDLLSPYKNELLKSTPVSSSLFLTYLGVKIQQPFPEDLKSNILLVVDKKDVKENEDLFAGGVMGIHAPSLWSPGINKKGLESLCLAVTVDYKDRYFWTKEIRKSYADIMCEVFSKFFPNILKGIVLRDTASPVTLKYWTANYHGAAFGWASTVQQFGNPEFSQKTEFENFYTTGHWSNQGSGISLVANCGRNAANLILRKEGKK
ncbi:MAG: NAD(P)/FAD-dependent oxidoreductase [Patescibacteria group bacterium]